VQLFESCADLPDLDQYLEFALPYQQEVFSRIESRVPRILFSKGFSHLAHLQESGADVLSLAGGCTIAEARMQVGTGVALQGNVSNRLLAGGTPAEIGAAVRACIASGGHCGHVLNLDHGLLQNTPWEHVELMVSLARVNRVAAPSAGARE
jgi:uroporphyrinogen decarboxylase